MESFSLFFHYYKKANKAISRMGTPKYLITGHDPLFEFHRWKANLRILDVEGKKPFRTFHYLIPSSNG